MPHTHTFPPLGRLVSLAYAGTDMPVHMVCESASGCLTPWKLDYPAFSRLLRERADRGSAIVLLEAFRQCRPLDCTTGLRRWSLIQVRLILKNGLSLDPDTAMSAPPHQFAA